MDAGQSHRFSQLHILCQQRIFEHNAKNLTVSQRYRVAQSHEIRSTATEIPTQGQSVRVKSRQKSGFLLQFAARFHKLNLCSQLEFATILIVPC